ncbi:MAG: hypothetical protein HOO96_36710 [Polyangiaceae bacterium]|nr:hypothetical protein [Polyangiaceae bacterium]
MSRSIWIALLAASVAAALGIACTPAKDAWSDDPRPIVTTWRSKCALCHTRVEPGTRTPEKLHEALGRHHVRVHLSDAEWVELEAFLGNKAPAAPPSASPPSP